MASQKTLETPILKTNNDRFTDLPDSIIHRIFSFLDTDNVVAMKSVSKRFLQLYLTSPYLSFTSKCYDGRYNHFDDKCKQFRDSLDWFWSCLGRKNDAAAVDISRLHIGWTCKPCLFGDKDSIVNAWIREAAKYNVQELDIKIEIDYLIPECIFNCKSLTVLKIKGSCVYLPTRLVFHSLQVLSLQCPLPDGDDKVSLGEWISKSCPSLKKLSLNKLTKHDHIFTSSSIEELTVSMETYGRYGGDSGYDITILMENLKTLSLDFPCSYDLSLNNSVQIIAPNLQDFTFKAKFKKCEFSGEFMSLHTASINVPADSNYLVELHRSISWARSLQIKFLALETLFKDGHCRQLLIENVHYLILNVGKSSNDEYIIPSIISFLKQMLHIKSLTIKHPQNRHCSSLFDRDRELDKYTTDVEHNEPRNNLMLFQSLKEVVIELSTGTKYIGLVKYLLEYAQGLETITVMYANYLFYELLEIDIRNFETASPLLELLFVQKEFVRVEENDY